MLSAMPRVMAPMKSESVTSDASRMYLECKGVALN